MTEHNRGHWLRLADNTAWANQTPAEMRRYHSRSERVATLWLADFNAERDRVLISLGQQPVCAANNPTRRRST